MAVPPDLHDGGGVLCCNPERERLLAQVALASDPWSVEVLVGDDNADTVVRRWRGQGHDVVTLLVPPRDQRAAAILVRAAAAGDVSVQVRHTNLDGTIPELPPPVHAAWTQLPVEPEAWQEWLASVVAGCASPLPVAPPALAVWPSVPTRRSPIPEGFRLEDPRWRRRLLELAGECAPAAAAGFRFALGCHDLGTNPTEDFFADLGLLEHSADLLVNIVAAKQS